jgi:hypothetical protein
MDEIRIKELAEQCRQYYRGIGPNYPQFDEVKFAKLLLTDCANHVKIWEKDSRNHISYMIRNHYNLDNENGK